MIQNFIIMLKKCLISLILIFPLFLFAQEAAQEESPSLSESYKTIYDNAETYNAYKVIKITTLNELWRNVQDSLRTYKNEIAIGKQEISNLNSNIEDLNGRISELEQNLSNTQKKVDSISFLGILISKNTYNIIVWGIIFGLGIFVFLGYSSHSRSRKLYNITRKEFTNLVQEFESLKKTSTEKKIKLGRELQTERNKVVELEARLKDRGDRLSSI